MQQGMNEFVDPGHKGLMKQDFCKEKFSKMAEHTIGLDGGKNKVLFKVCPVRLYLFITSFGLP